MRLVHLALALGLAVPLGCSLNDVDNFFVVTDVVTMVLAPDEFMAQAKEERRRQEEETNPALENLRRMERQQEEWRQQVEAQQRQMEERWRQDEARRQKEAERWREDILENLAKTRHR